MVRLGLQCQTPAFPLAIPKKLGSKKNKTRLGLQCQTPAFPLPTPKILGLVLSTRS